MCCFDYSFRCRFLSRLHTKLLRLLLLRSMYFGQSIPEICRLVCVARAYTHSILSISEICERMRVVRTTSFHPCDDQRKIRLNQTHGERYPHSRIYVAFASCLPLAVSVHKNQLTDFNLIAPHIIKLLI